MLIDQEYRKRIISQVSSHILSAQNEVQHINDFFLNLQFNVHRLIELSQELLELCKRHCSEKEMKKYSSKMHTLIVNNKCQMHKIQQVCCMNLNDNNKQRDSLSKEIIKLTTEINSLQVTKQKLEKDIQLLYIKQNDEMSQISIKSLQSSTNTIQSMMEQSQKENIQEHWKIQQFSKQYQIMNISMLHDLQMSVDQIAVLKCSIRQQLQLDVNQLKQLNEKLLQNQHRIRRLEQFEKEQINIIKEKQLSLFLE